MAAMNFSADEETSGNTSLLCTSCKCKNKAVALCSDCVDFLCVNCNVVHRYMRCFDNHKFFDFEELKKSDEAINTREIVSCEIHPSENVKYYCYTCKASICNKCLLEEHKAPNHSCEKLSNAGKAIGEGDLVKLIVESERKIEDCKEISSTLKNALDELHICRDKTKDVITETFQIYMTILEKVYNGAWENLEKLFSEQTCRLANDLKSAEKMIEKMKRACDFTNKLLMGGSSVEIMSLCRIVRRQLVNFIENPESQNTVFSIQFKTDHNSFEKAVKETFGKCYIVQENPQADENEYPNVSSAASMGFPNSISSDSVRSSSESSYIDPPMPALPIDANARKFNLKNLSKLVKDNSGEDFGPSIFGGNVFPQINEMEDLANLLSTHRKCAPMQIRCKFGHLGNDENQFNSPHGFCLGINEDIVVADTNNHRIQVFDKHSTYKFHFGIAGKEEGQLWCPRKVAVIKKNGHFVVCDRGNERSRMQVYTRKGHFVKKITIRFIDIVAGLAVTNQDHVVLVDSVNPTVFVISVDTGTIIQWFDCSDYMREPSDIAINGNEFYVCDFKGHCVVVFNEQGQYLRRIGSEDMTNFPSGIDLSDEGDILIGDSHGNRFHVAVFSKEGNFISEFECPHVKISRCCGLKVTSDGHVITVAKNNHYLLIFNTLYIM